MLKTYRAIGSKSTETWELDAVYLGIKSCEIGKESINIMGFWGFGY
jgi:hypothetical protein